MTTGEDDPRARDERGSPARPAAEAAPSGSFRVGRLLLLVLLFCGLLTAFLSLTLTGLGRGVQALLAAAPGGVAAAGAALALDRAGRGP